MTTSRVSDDQRRRALRDPLHLLSFGLGTGFAPWAPGTVGTALAVPLAWYLGQLGFLIYALTTLVITVSGIWLCERTSRWLNTHDHRAIVIDEIAGYLITMLLLPKTWLWLLAGFVAFRAFDIFKPPPITWLDGNVKGGLGIMLDDVAAAIYASLALYIVVWGYGLITN